MRRTHHSAEPSCTGADEDVPSCTTGPGGQLRFVARELAGIARGLLRAAGRRDASAAGSHHAAGEERDQLGGEADQGTSHDDGIAR